MSTPSTGCLTHWLRVAPEPAIVEFQPSVLDGQPFAVLTGVGAPAGSAEETT